jgi:hypothetical protein
MNLNSDRKKILDRLAKILALAEGTAFSAEADAFLKRRVATAPKTAGRKT